MLRRDSELTSNRYLAFRRAWSWAVGYGLCVADDMLQELGYGLCVADDMLQDDRNMLRQESLIPGGEHLGQRWGNLAAIFG